MANILGKIVADFSTSLATKVAIGGTSATLQSATDDDGVALPTGTYFLTVDGNSSLKEYWQCTLTGTALTSIRNITRQGTQASGSVREHRIGASVKITNFAHLKYINDLLSGDATIDADLVFDGNDLTGVNSIAGLATPTSGETTKAANVDYVNLVALAGAPDAADTVKGVVELATQAEVNAGDDSGSTTAPVVVIPSRLAVAVQNQKFVYGESGGIAAVMTFTPVPAITALAAGQRHSIKMTTACPGACTLAVSGLTAKNVKKYVAGAIADVEANDWVIGSIADFEYDGTQYLLMNPSASTMTTALMTEAGTFFGATDITGAEAQTLTAGDTSNASGLHKHLITRGLASKAVSDGASTQTIVHGLGVTPKLVRIHCIHGGTAQYTFVESFGTGTSTSDEGCMYANVTGSGTSTSIQDSSNIIHTRFNGTDIAVANITTLDATNIILTYTTNASSAALGNASTQLIEWEAYS